MNKKHAAAWLSSAVAVTKVCGKTVLWTVLSLMIAALIICRPRPIRYVTHCVAPGETLWGIAKEYNPEVENVDVVLYEMKKKNGINSSVIYAGDVIEVPLMGW